MRMTLLTSAAVLGLALALPAFAQTATDPTPANPSAIKDGTPAAGTGSGAAPGNDPATSGKTGATLGAQAPQQDPGPLGNTTNPAPQGNTSAPASSTEMGTSGTSTDQTTAPASHPKHRRMSNATHGMGSSADETGAGGGHWAHQPGSGMSGPASAQASNIDSADTRSTIAPHLPQPGIGMNAGPDGYLRAADRALAAHKTGAAQQALEMAETRLLDRSTDASAASQPDQSPRIAAVTAARKALAQKDWKTARHSIQEAMNTGSGSMGNGGGMGSGGTASDSGSAMPAGSGSGGMQNGMGSSSGAMSASPNAATSTPPVNPNGMGSDGTHAVGKGNGGGPLGTTSNDSAGGAK